MPKPLELEETTSASKYAERSWRFLEEITTINPNLDGIKLISREMKLKV